MLTIQDLTVYYGKALALDKLSIDVKEGEIVTLLGANGAGKSTTLKAISGIVKARNGSIKYKNQELTEMNPGKIVELGITQVPEGRHVFPKMTVLENLEIGAYVVSDAQEVKSQINNMFELFPRLEERKSQKAGTLSGGEQQMLVIARSLMSNPDCVLLDEPSLGIAPVLVREIFEKIKELSKSRNLSVILVEQNASVALSIADRGYIIENGTVAIEGDVGKLKGNDIVRKTYLGI